MLNQSEHLNNINIILNNLISDTGYCVTDKIEYQFKYMKSETYNNDFDVIYDRLNRLYEKTRYLSDLSDSIEYYLKDYVGATQTEIASLLDTILFQRDTLKRNSDVVFVVNFKNEYNTDLIDRDGSAIDSKAFYTNNTLTLPIVSISDFQDIMDSVQINEFSAYKSYNYSKVNNLANNGVYRTLYCSSSPLDVKELVSISFNEPIRMNSFDLKLSNCEFDNMVYIFDNDSKVSIDNITNISSTRLIKGIEFDIVCSSGSTNTYTVEESTDTESYLNLRKQELYGTWENSAEHKINVLKEYSNQIESYDNLQTRYGQSGFYISDQSIDNQITVDGSMFSISDALKFGNPYPQIEVGNAYGKKGN